MERLLAIVMVATLTRLLLAGVTTREAPPQTSDESIPSTARALRAYSPGPGSKGAVRPTSD